MEKNGWETPGFKEPSQQFWSENDSFWEKWYMLQFLNFATFHSSKGMKYLDFSVQWLSKSRTVSIETRINPGGSFAWD